MKWVMLEPKEGDKINKQTIELLSDDSIICTVLFAVKDNGDGSKSPVFLLSQNFRDPEYFIDDFIRLLGEHAKVNQIKRNE